MNCLRVNCLLQTFITERGKLQNVLSTCHFIMKYIDFAVTIARNLIPSYRKLLNGCWSNGMKTPQTFQYFIQIKCNTAVLAQLVEHIILLTLQTKLYKGKLDSYSNILSIQRYMYRVGR